jgi:hypothetical protein
MKSLDYVIKKTAKELNLPEDQTRKLLTAYWKEIERQLVEIKSTTISIKKLGVITVSKIKIRNFIIDTIRRIRRMEKSTKYSDDKKRSYIDRHKKKLKNALIQRNILAKDYAEKFGNI